MNIRKWENKFRNSSLKSHLLLVTLYIYLLYILILIYSISVYWLMWPTVLNILKTWRSQGIRSKGIILQIEAQYPSFFEGGGAIYLIIFENLHEMELRSSEGYRVSYLRTKGKFKTRILMKSQSCTSNSAWNWCIKLISMNLINQTWISSLTVKSIPRQFPALYLTIRYMHRE